MYMYNVYVWSRARGTSVASSKRVSEPLSNRCRDGARSGRWLLRTLMSSLSRALLNARRHPPSNYTSAGPLPTTFNRHPPPPPPSLYFYYCVIRMPRHVALYSYDSTAIETRARRETKDWIREREKDDDTKRPWHVSIYRRRPRSIRTDLAFVFCI